MGLIPITPATDLPVTIALTKLHLRVDHSDEDELIEQYIRDAVDYSEQFTGRALCDQTWDLYLDAFPSAEIQIPKPPLIEVVSINYDDAGSGLETLMDAANYYVDRASSFTPAGSGWIVPNDNIGKVWPATLAAINSVRIRFRAGYVDTNSPVGPNVPFELRQAVLQIVASTYDNREDSIVGTTAGNIPLPAEILLRKYRVLLGMA